MAVDAGYLLAATGKASKSYEWFFGIPAIGVDFFVGKGLKRYVSVQIGILIQEHDYRRMSAPTVVVDVNSTRSEIMHIGEPAPKTIRPDLKVSFPF